MFVRDFVQMPSIGRVQCATAFTIVLDTAVPNESGILESVYESAKCVTCLHPKGRLFHFRHVLEVSVPCVQPQSETHPPEGNTITVHGAWLGWLELGPL